MGRVHCEHKTKQSSTIKLSSRYSTPPSTNLCYYLYIIYQLHMLVCSVAVCFNFEVRWQFLNGFNGLLLYLDHSFALIVSSNRILRPNTYSYKTSFSNSFYWIAYEPKSKLYDKMVRDNYILRLVHRKLGCSPKKKRKKNRIQGSKWNSRKFLDRE